MKNIFLGLFVFLTIVACAQPNVKNQFILKGKVDGLKAGWLLLYYTSSGGNRVTDSAALQNGNFSFRGKVSEPSMAYLMLKEEKRNDKNSVQFFIEPSAMTVNLPLNNFNDARFTGSKTQAEYALLNQSNQLIQKQMESVQKEYQEANEKYMAAIKNKADEATLNSLKDDADAIHEKFTPYTEKIQKNTLAFFSSHPQSAVTANMLRYYVSSLSVDTLELFYKRLGAKMQQTSAGKELAGEIAKLKGGSPGSPAKDFSTKDINGNPLTLAEFRGKYVLLDFWASWCGPCRKGNPHLKELYTKYKDQGIEFIGISDDDSKEDAWRKAVAQDGLPWRHILRGFDMAKRMKNETNPADISEKYGIHTLPTKILIDRSGIIIGRYSSEEGPLDSKLKEIFDTAGK